MAIASYPATIKAGATVINDIDNFELPFKMDTVETTAFSGSGGATPGAKTFIPTLLGMVQKVSGSWNKADPGQLALETAFFARTEVAIVASPNGTNTYSFSAWVSDYDIKAAVKGKIDADYTLTMNGNVTLV